MTEQSEMKAFHTAFDDISKECEDKDFRLPNSTDFGFGWRKAREFYKAENQFTLPLTIFQLRDGTLELHDKNGMLIVCNIVKYPQSK